MNRRNMIALTGALGLGWQVDATLGGARAAQPAAPVICFSGWVEPWRTAQGTATAALVRRLRQRGVAAELHDPNDWPELAVAYLMSQPRDLQPTIVGYSLGAQSAILLANRLSEAGVRIAALILLEAYDPPPVSADVFRVIHYFVSSVARRVVAGPGFGGYIANIDLKQVDPDFAASGHLEINHFTRIQNLILLAILQGRPEYPAPPVVTPARAPPPKAGNPARRGR